MDYCCQVTPAFQLHGEDFDRLWKCLLSKWLAWRTTGHKLHNGCFQMSHPINAFDTSPTRVLWRVLSAIDNVPLVLFNATLDGHCASRIIQWFNCMSRNRLLFQLDEKVVVYVTCKNLSHNILLPTSSIAITINNIDSIYE